MFAVAFKACTECSYIEQVTVRWMDAHSQAPAWHLPAQVLEVGSTGWVCATQSSGAAHTEHLDSATLLLIAPVIPIPGLSENLKPLKTLVREPLSSSSNVWLFQKSINIAYLIFFFFSPRILQESLNW